MAKLPIADFLTARLKEFDPNFEIRKGTGLEQLFIKPMQFLLQPIADEAALLNTSQSFLRILQQQDPDAFSEEAVDALASNLFVTRDPGGVSSGVARVYYTEPVNREWPARGASFTGSNSLLYTNPSPYAISIAQTSAQIENGSYYLDIPIVSVDRGPSTELPVAGIISINSDTDALTASNAAPISGGTQRETNTQLIERVRKSIAVRDLVTGKGFNATMFDNFVGFLTELQQIGFGDVEMMRDIVYNTHIGGKVDSYFKTAKILSGHKNFTGLLPDYTRQSYTSTNIILPAQDPVLTGDGNFDVTGDKRPIVQEVKVSKIARFTCLLDLSSPLNLPANSRITIAINTTAKEISLAGAVPSATTRSEIVTHINNAFGYPVCFAVGTSFELRTPTKGKSSEILIADPLAGTSGLLSVFGLSAPTVVYGDGPLVFTELVHYTVNVDNGAVTRIRGPFILGDTSFPKTTGMVSITTGRVIFNDPTPSIFSSVVTNDIITQVLSSTQTVDYRIIDVIDDNNVVLDVIAALKGSWNPVTNTPRLENGKGNEGDIYRVTTNGSFNFGAGTISFLAGDYVIYASGIWSMVIDPIMTDVSYYITRTGIKDKETVYIQYWYNPISIDVGPLVWNQFDDFYSPPIPIGRGIRPGREDLTITDVSFLRVTSIDIIDPITFEPTGEVLVTGGGYGQGGYGEGPYGTGGGSDYTFRVNSPTERFSAFEDSYIIFHPSLIGLSFRVNYEYVPECMTLHNFVRSESERVLDGDILMKHFLPAYVSGEITYKVDSTDSLIPDNDTLTARVKEFISNQPSGTDLKTSDVYQFIARTTDPYDRYGSYVKPFTLTATIHNTDGTTTLISSDDKLVVPTPVPFPKDTPRPLSPRITHWIGDNIVLTRES